VPVCERGPRLVDQHIHVGGLQHRLGQRLIHHVDRGAAAEQAARFLQRRARGGIIALLQGRLRLVEFRMAHVLQSRQRVFVVGVQRARGFVQVARAVGAAGQVARRVCGIRACQQRVQLRLRQHAAEHRLMAPQPADYADQNHRQHDQRPPPPVAPAQRAPAHRAGVERRRRGSRSLGLTLTRGAAPVRARVELIEITQRRIGPARGVA